MARIDAITAGGKDRLAFLDMLAWSEIGPELLAKSDDGYNVEVSSTPANPKLFIGYAHHPHVFEIVNKTGLKSSAAGRYQFLFKTWAELKADLHLPDFGPWNQDRAALELVRREKALEALDAGDIAGAISSCANIWASLPGANYGQHEQRMVDLVQAYNQALSKY